jgi:hypothetical protein
MILKLISSQNNHLMCFAKKLVIIGVMNIVFQFSNVASLASIKEGFNIKWYLGSKIPSKK